MELDRILNLRWHMKSCCSCRYYRICTTGGSHSECLLLGRTLGITSKGNYPELDGWARQRLCDGWKRRPKKWKIHCEGPKSNPYHFDLYIKKKTLDNLRGKMRKINA